MTMEGDIGTRLEPAGAGALRGLSGLSPLARRLAATWLVVAAVVAAGLLIEYATRDGLDGENPIRERVGVAFDSGFPVPEVAGVVDGKRTVVLFVRPGQAAAVCRWAAGTPLSGITMVAVAPERVSCPGVKLTEDRDERIADGFRMREPKDGDYPVGYAILDSSGQLRYNTLDRHYHKRNWWDRQLYNGKKWEMQTMLKEIS